MSPSWLRRWKSAVTRLFSGQANFGELQGTIGYTFSDVEVLSEALSHRSYVRTAANSQCPSFERMEFLGDSVLGMLVAEQLFRLYPECSEGELTKLKSALVNEQTLALIARDMRLGDHIRLSEEEANAGGRERPSITSDCFEALLGAIYLDGGIGPAENFVRKFVVSRISEVQNNRAIRNFKGELLEITQGASAGTPRYDVISESGPDHDKTFTVVVHGFGVELARGSGHSKKEAEQVAAGRAQPEARILARKRRPKQTGQEEM
ncbi:MAG: ribonuclease III [Candidatus Zixiibacteriota bacterium]